jgi:hypothetical protein
VDDYRRHAGFTEYGEYPDAWPVTMVHEVEEACGKLAKWLPVTAIDLAAVQQALLVALQHQVPPARLLDAIAQAAGILVAPGATHQPTYEEREAAAMASAVPEPTVDPYWDEAGKQHQRQE